MFDTFYDKEITLYTKEDTTDSEGHQRVDDLSVASTFMANVSYDRLDRVQEQYGIKVRISAVLSTNANIPNGSILSYQGNQWEVVRAVINDSHNLLIVKEWSSRSSTSISS